MPRRCRLPRVPLGRRSAGSLIHWDWPTNSLPLLSCAASIQLVMRVRHVPRSAVGVVIVAGVRVYRENLAAALEPLERIEVHGTAADWSEAFGYIHGRRRTSFSWMRTLSPRVAVRGCGAHRAPRPSCRARGGRGRGLGGQVPRSRRVGVRAQRRAAGGADRDDRAGCGGELLCSPRIAGALGRRLSDLAAEREPSTDAAHLTTREIEVVHLIGQNCPIATSRRVSTSSPRRSRTTSTTSSPSCRSGSRRRGRLAAGRRGLSRLSADEPHVGDGDALRGSRPRRRPSVPRGRTPPTDRRGRARCHDRAVRNRSIHFPALLGVARVESGDLDRARDRAVDGVGPLEVARARRTRACTASPR